MNIEVNLTISKYYAAAKRRYHVHIPTAVTRAVQEPLLSLGCFD